MYVCVYVCMCVSMCRRIYFEQIFLSLPRSCFLVLDSCNLCLSLVLTWNK